MELLEKGKAPVVKTALTGSDGSYVFFGVLPGAYTIRVSQDAQSLYSFEKTTQVVSTDAILPMQYAFFKRLLFPPAGH